MWNRHNDLALYSHSSDLITELLDCDVLTIVEVSAVACDVLQVGLRELNFAF